MWEETLSGGIRIRGENGFPLSTDSVLLSAFAALPCKAAVADLGAGVGTIGLLLCARYPDCRITGIELQECACRTAAENITLNHLEDRFTILNTDLRELRTLPGAGRFDCVVSNPPYFPAHSGFLSAAHGTAIAKAELCCTLTDVCAAAGWLLRSGGSFFMVHRPQRLCDVICCLREKHLEPKRLRFVRHHALSPASLVLVEARKDAHPGLSCEADLLQFLPDGTPTEAYRAIYHL